jgi:hypothetical protein
MAQVARVHVATTNAISNEVYGLRPAEEVRDCQGLPFQGLRPAPCLPASVGK